MKNLKALIVLIAFVFTTIAPPQGWAQSLALKSNSAFITAVGLMPQPGRSVSLSAGFELAHFKGMVIDPHDPFKFDFIIHQGDQRFAPDQKKQEYTKLIKYFLAALAVPDTDQWVNLSPYEKNRIIPVDFGKTAMGRDLLAQDYLLKQLSSSLTNPQTGLGQEFWDKVYGQVYKEFGRRDIPLNTFNKVWIIPDKAVIYEKGNMMYVIESHLKVMTEEDYLARKNHHQDQVSGEKGKAVKISNAVMREIIIPAIEEEVNKGKNFAPLRQVFSGMLLATWYKIALKESILTKLYANKGKLKGVDQDPKANEKIYQQYIKAYKKGVYNMIKEEADPVTQEVIPRKYFSGGFTNNDCGMIMRRDGSAAAALADYTAESGAEERVVARVRPPMAGKIAKTALGIAAVSGLAFHPVNAHSQTNTVPGTTALAWNQSLDTVNPIDGSTNKVLNYRVYYSPTPDFANSNVVDVVGTQAVISNLPLTTLYYRVSVVFSNSLTHANAETGPSAALSLTPLPNINWSTNAQSSVQLNGFVPGATVSTNIDTPNLVKSLTVDTNTGFVTAFPNNQFGNLIIDATVNGNAQAPTLNGIKQYFIEPINPVPTVQITKLIPQLNKGKASFVQIQAQAPNVGPFGYPINFYYTTNLNNPNWTYFGKGNIVNTNTTSIITVPFPITNGIPPQMFFMASGTNTTLTNSSGTNTIPPVTSMPKSGPEFETFAKAGGFSVPANAHYNFEGPRPQISPQLVQLDALELKNKKRGSIDQGMINTRGGIDFAQSNLDLQIKHDGKGMSLPVSQQNLDNIHIDGLVPEILDIKPVESALLFGKIIQGDPLKAGP